MLPASIESSVDANMHKGNGHTIPYVYMSVITESNIVMKHPLLNGEPLSVGYKNCHSNIFTVYRLETNTSCNKPMNSTEWRLQSIKIGSQKIALATLTVTPW